MTITSLLENTIECFLNQKNNIIIWCCFLLIKY
jgi:hypothetical protein